jgi:hypothetical protein
LRQEFNVGFSTLERDAFDARLEIRAGLDDADTKLLKAAADRRKELAQAPRYAMI